MFIGELDAVVCVAAEGDIVSVLATIGDVQVNTPTFSAVRDLTVCVFVCHHTAFITSHLISEHTLMYSVENTAAGCGGRGRAGGGMEPRPGGASAGDAAQHRHRHEHRHGRAA